MRYECFRHPPYAEPYPYRGARSPYAPPSVPPLPDVDCEIIVLDEKQRLEDDIQIQLLKIMFILA